MALRIGWLSSGRDPAARNLLKTVYDDITGNQIPADINWIFCHRETGDGPLNDEYRDRELFFDLAASLDIPVATLSHIRFMPELRKKGLTESPSAAEASPALEEWRNLYGQEVMKVIDMLPPVDIIVMAGYMLILGEPELDGLVLVNIHPALPWGPRGTWQEVIHQLIAEEAAEQGIMIHIVTKELDRGPVISYCRFPIRGEEWSELWSQWQQDIGPEAARETREGHPLFRKIRMEGEIRELPLLRSAIRELAFENITIKDKKIWAGGNPLEAGVDLTSTIERIVRAEVV
ncbi:MAG: phosphoribosylglycinamide formyltransferase [Desulfomonile tiedjei]|nr:phosphoribosylglycinamide formyltransferase [Desulfomonile tiedjei]